jgi:threonine/homoserine/homoserine lactone efflux protein
MLAGMDLSSTLPAFVLAVLLISASPGPAMALILRRAAVHGTRAAVPTVLGLELGLYVWALAAGAGLAALVAASDVAYTVLRVVGALVLLYLGVQAWRAALTGGHPEERPGAPSARSWRRSFGEGVVVQLANPKAAVFMFAFYPQFVPPTGRSCSGPPPWAAAGEPRDGPVPRPGCRGRTRLRLVPTAAHPPSARGGVRHRPDRARGARGRDLPLTCSPQVAGALHRSGSAGDDGVGHLTVRRTAGSHSQPLCLNSRWSAMQTPAMMPSTRK